jgi:hypothetical protein
MVDQTESKEESFKQILKNFLANDLDEEGRGIFLGLFGLITAFLFLCLIMASCTCTKKAIGVFEDPDVIVHKDKYSDPLAQRIAALKELSLLNSDEVVALTKLIDQAETAPGDGFSVEGAEEAAGPAGQDPAAVKDGW